MTRAESNRAIAETLGFTTTVVHFQPAPLHLDSTEILWVNPHTGKAASLPDFYTSEDASAMLLEAMLRDGLGTLRYYKLFETDPGWFEYTKTGYFTRQDRDRKTAIAEAFKRWKGIQ